VGVSEYQVAIAKDDNEWVAQDAGEIGVPKSSAISFGKSHDMAFGADEQDFVGLHAGEV